MRKITAIILAILITISLAACNPASSTGDSQAGSQTDSGSKTDTSGTSNSGSSGSSTIDASGVTIDNITLGSDYTDIKANLKVMTNRTDLVETVMPEYSKKFQDMYPNITVSWEAMTDYQQDMTTRLSTPQWGDICLIPQNIDKPDLGEYFMPLGDTATLLGTYNFVDNMAYEGTTYGIPCTNVVQGILYNKAVFEKAGVTKLPTTPDEFLAALKAVKDNTDAIPLYTNFAAMWTLSTWDSYIGGSATGDPNFTQRILPHETNPFADRGDGTGPYAVYYTLYEAVARGLTEDDPTTTDWEGSKVMLNSGEVATMVLGSWAIVQMQDAGPNADDIGYMNFPITVDGKQYASSGPDYCYAINKNTSDEQRLASLLFVKFMVEESNFDFDQGGIPTVKSHPLPGNLSSLDGSIFVSDNPPLAGEEDLLAKIISESELGITQAHDHVAQLVEAGKQGIPLADIIADWNARWTDAQQKAGA